jgi:endonuclease III
MAVARKKIALAVLVAVAVSAQAVEDYINLPNANFQNYYKCSGDLETLAPKSVEGIQQAVRRASHVQGRERAIAGALQNCSSWLTFVTIVAVNIHHCHLFLLLPQEQAL